MPAAHFGLGIVVAGVWCDAQHAPKQISLSSLPRYLQVLMDIKADSV